MSQRLQHYYDFDPAVKVAMYDPSDTDYSVEGMERTHELAEEARAAHIVGSSVLSVVAPNSLKQNPTVGELKAVIDAVHYRSELNNASRQLNKALVSRRISNDEYDELLELYYAKKASLEVSRQTIEQSWSPSDVLSTIPSVGRRDWQERAANDRHDKGD